jgi:1-acyl-sn-glycerol-3-phosphate acyltransferase
MTFFITLVRLILFLTWSVLMVSLQAGCVLLKLPVRLRIPHRWHKGATTIVGIRKEIIGSISREKPTLYVSNHVSYLDIIVLGSLLDAHFVSKKEVASWPLFGTLAKVGQTIFIERNPRLAMEQREDLAAMLAEKRSIILFPEGTSSSGNRILPFKSTLFSVASLLQQQDVPVTIQPITLAYTRLDGIPLRRVMRPLIAWYGDMAMGNHLWTLMGLGKLTVTVTFHPPVSLEQFNSRKETSAWCQRQLALGLRQSYTPLAQQQP